MINHIDLLIVQTWQNFHSPFHLGFTDGDLMGDAGVGAVTPRCVILISSSLAIIYTSGKLHFQLR